MQRKMIIMEIPDGHQIDKLSIPKLSYCRQDEEGVDIFVSAPVKIIDCPIPDEELEELDWKLRFTREELTRGCRKVITDPELKKRILNAANSSACDIDGDIVYVDGVPYFVHIMADVVKTDIKE